eukprot:TRINITY_DN23412_c0_g1_i1.p1 TRINITY_DN23412_c0_g1~~TRINITY_DN23412_c0_g1_i1.p1  ORF type:complete len:129 (+),score=24.93 TRINITY_DN23412_c0_g1_i1:340-726(+)
MVSGRGRRQLQMLWRKYGEKTLKPDPKGSPSEIRIVTRQYFKCHQPHCKARLKVDVIAETQQQVNAKATGGHCHDITVQVMHADGKKSEDRQASGAVSRESGEGCDRAWIGSSPESTDTGGMSVPSSD